MNQQTHDAEGAALAKIYRLLLEKAEKQKTQKKVMAGETATTIQGFDNRSGSNGNNHHDK